MLVITPDQHTHFQADARGRFAVRLRDALTTHAVTGAQARSRPPAWYDWAVDRALGYGIEIEADVAEFAAQLLMHGDAVLDRADVRALLEPVDKDGWLKVLQFARGQLLIPRPED